MMAEITFKKSINSVRHLAEYQYAENFIDYPDAENFDEYQYAKNFLNDPRTLEGMERSLAEMIVYLYKTSRPQESFPSLSNRRLPGDQGGVGWAEPDRTRPASKGKTTSPRPGRMDRRRAGGPIGGEEAETAAPTEQGSP